MKKVSLILSVSLLTALLVSSFKESSHISKQHKTAETIIEVTIGKQVWLAQNLNVDKFRNGDPIPEAKTEEQWIKAGTKGQPAWCYYNNDTANASKYGKLYNWHAVNDARGIAPKGQHIPTDDEWTKLTEYFGDDEVAGKMIKSKDGWKDNNNGTNESRFSGLPGGARGYDGKFNNMGTSVCWWTSTDDAANNIARFVGLASGMSVGADDKGQGFSVRCLKD